MVSWSLSFSSEWVLHRSAQEVSRVHCSPCRWFHLVSWSQLVTQSRLPVAIRPGPSAPVCPGPYLVSVCSLGPDCAAFCAQLVAMKCAVQSRFLVGDPALRARVAAPSSQRRPHSASPAAPPSQRRPRSATLTAPSSLRQPRSATLAVCPCSTALAVLSPQHHPRSTVPAAPPSQYCPRSTTLAVLSLQHHPRSTVPAAPPSQRRPRSATLAVLSLQHHSCAVSFLKRHPSCGKCHPNSSMSAVSSLQNGSTILATLPSQHTTCLMVSPCGRHGTAVQTRTPCCLVLVAPSVGHCTR